MPANVPARIEGGSEQLWRCRRATEIADHNRSRETILEKAVANLAEQGHMPGWFNQCPVASGIADPHVNNRRAVDLVHLSGGSARLIELKWTSNTPVHALFQILEYGLTYVLTRLRKGELRLDDRQLMQVRHIGLEVVRPPLTRACGSYGRAAPRGFHDAAQFMRRVTASVEIRWLRRCLVGLRLGRGRRTPAGSRRARPATSDMASPTALNQH